MPAKLIYLADDLEATVDRILADDELEGLGLNRAKVKRALKSFRGDEIAASVFLKKYALRDTDGKAVETTLEEAKERWAQTVAEAEQRDRKKWAERFRQLYDYFLPAGRQMFALGNCNVVKATLTNCYVTKIADDSIEGIYGAAESIAKTFSYGGGIGLCIGELRPRGAKVSNSALFSTGAVSFMDLFSLTSGLIGQSFRRGALMITIPVDHPDIEEFVEIKHGNTEKVKYANISIKLTDEFMRAVEAGGDFTLSFETKHGRTEKTLPARDLWRRIVTSARDSAEPGLMFWDRMVEMSPSEIYEGLQVHSTNPCVTADTWIQTGDGPRLVSDLIGAPFAACVSSGRYNSDCGFFSTGVKPVFRLHTQEGFTLRLTADHELKVVTNLTRYRCDTEWRSLKDIQPGDRLLLTNHRDQPRWHGPGTMDEGYLMGCLVGDGTLKHSTAVLSTWKKDKGSIGIRQAVMHAVTKMKKRADFQGWLEVEERGEYRLALTAIRDYAMALDMRPGDKCVSAKIERTSRDFHIGFLRGFFDTDGSVQGDQNKGVSVRLSQSDLPRLWAVQRMLARLGIISTVYKNRRTAGKRSMPDGRGGMRMYNTKASHDLVIADDNLFVFAKMVGFNHEAKNRALKAALKAYRRQPNRERFVVRVEKIVEDGMEEVFDAQVSHVHRFDANGFVAHNCGEQILEPGGACVLGSMLLHTFVEKPFTDEAEFNYELFTNMVRGAVRHLDNVVTLNMGKHALSEQEQAARSGRRIGLGVTGLADMLAAMGLQYDSSEALELVEQIMEHKRNAEYTASMNLAAERGSFELFDRSRHYERGFPATLPEELKTLGHIQGQRNVAISTIAPSGSLSIIAQCSSGIEPVFALRYKRYVELGDERKEFEVRHQGVARFMEATGRDDLPGFWVTAHQIHHESRIRMQAALQKFVDASISSTINLPEGVDVDTVAGIYMEAWKAGLKGVTVYREGSREGILITDDYAKKAGRPVVDTVVHKVRAEGGDKFYIPVSYRGGDLRKPYQVFILNYKATENDRLIKLGNDLVRMIRNAGVCEKRIEKYLSRSRNSLSKVTRFISLALKADLLEECVEVLDQHAFAGTLAAELHNIFARSLAIGKLLCKECGSHNVRHEEGCKRCLDCGWTGCG